MNLINKKLLQQKIHSFNFPKPEQLANSKKLLEGWHKALKDSDLEKTKEKSVQGKFLSTFFEAILGYSDVTTGQDEWTLIQHPRIENDSKEPDGSLGWFTKDKKTTRAVIELKDAKTQLDKKQNRGSEKLTPVEQAYLYATKYEGCNWIIVSNFKEIRLYNKHRTQEYYEKFDVIDLIEETEFKRFYFLLSKETLLSKEKESITDNLAKDTTEAEQDITKKFYSEYRQVRLNLLGHLSEHNPNIEKNILLEKTQKLLDRIVFTLFCEDTSSLLPLNIVKNTYERAINSLSPSDERVWSEFKGLFLAIDKGNKRVMPPINAYNGGLFAFDEILDNLSIKDESWLKLMHLADYDFETDLNVNILGHIFEQSISDLESLKSELLGEGQEEKKSKRKKDGIYYTPEYITRYIVENTIGKYLEENPDRLSTIKILDPACGSGAFLNQAHSFITNEYKIRYEAFINEKLAKKESISLFDYNPTENNKEILLNNLYGVDLNQESVEITKLALWLKTASRTEPLHNLDKNIKCGNSLIDDPEIVGEKAFRWSEEFKEIMNEGGFDVIIGNPPWVFTRGGNYAKNITTYYAKFIDDLVSGEEKGLNLQYNKLNLFSWFLVHSVSLLKPNGLLSFIVPNTLLRATNLALIRKYLLEDTRIVEIVELGSKVFDGVTAASTIITLQKRKTDYSNEIAIKKNVNDLTLGLYEEDKIPQSYYLKNKDWNINIHIDTSIIELLKKIEETPNHLDKLCRYISPGIDGSIEEDVSNKPNSDMDKPLLFGKDIGKYIVKFNDNFIHYDRSKLNRARKEEIFLSKKIVLQRISGGLMPLKGTVDYEKYYTFNSINNIILYDENLTETICAILNSKVINWYYTTKFTNRSELTVNISQTYLSKIPIPSLSSTIASMFSVEVKKLIELKTTLRKTLINQASVISEHFNLNLEDISFEILLTGWNEFVDALEKKKMKLDIKQKEELLIWFKSKQKDLRHLQNQINFIDSHIDQEIYKLYGLNEEEMQIIEKSTTK